MTWEMIGSLTAFSAILGVAVWRFARLESAVKHQARCQSLMLRAVVKLSRRVRGCQARLGIVGRADGD